MDRLSDRTVQPLPEWLSVTGRPLDLSFNDGFLGKCSSISSFEKLNQLGQGAYGIVYRALDLRDSKVYALKQIRITPRERHNGLPISALREISILQSLRHENIINVVDVAVDDFLMDEVYMVMEYVEQDLTVLLDDLRVKFTLGEVKCLFRQLLEALDYLHCNNIIHRDVKVQNILLTSNGILKLADFGMARSYTSERPLTAGVVTIWYRSPELLLGTQHYTPSVDMWSAGCILGELLLCKPLLPGENTVHELVLTQQLIGSPSAADLSVLRDMQCPELISWESQDGGLMRGRRDDLERVFGAENVGWATLDVLRGLLKWDPGMRWTAYETLGKGHSREAESARRWWRSGPRETRPEFLPTFLETFPEVRNQREHEEDDMTMPTTTTERDYMMNENDNESMRPTKRRRVA